MSRLMRNAVISLFVLSIAGLVGCERSDVTLYPQLDGADCDSSACGMGESQSDTFSDAIIDYRDEILNLWPWVSDSESDSNLESLSRLYSDPRKAVAGEAILAVCGWDWKVSRAINGWAVSDWNYLASDLNAYNWLKRRYGKYCSCWITQRDPYDIRAYWGFRYKPVSFFSQVNSYGFYGRYGRFGQCPAFADAILYRSGVYQSGLPSYATCRRDYNGARRFTKPISKVRVGDIIRTKWDNGHTAIVVKIMAGSAGRSVTSVDVVDANYVGGAGKEIIGRHIISVRGTGSGVGDLDNYYAVDLVALGGR